MYIARAGDVTGMLPFSRMTSYGATVRAVLPTRIVRLSVALFPEMLDRIPVLESRLVGILSYLSASPPGWRTAREALRLERSPPGWPTS